MSSPLRPALVNRTNAAQSAGSSSRDKDPQSPSDRKRPLVVKSPDDSPVQRKRVKIQLGESVDEEENEDEDSSEEEDEIVNPRIPRGLIAFEVMSARMGVRPGGMSRLPSCE